MQFKVIDLRSIGFVANSPEAAKFNMTKLRYEVALVKDASLHLLVRDHYYLDLSEGPIEFNVGHTKSIANLWIDGPGTLEGINSNKPTDPVMVLDRRSGTIPHINLKHLDIISTSSGIKVIHGGMQCRFEDVTIHHCSGAGVIDYEGWSDFNTAGYGLKLEDVDVIWADGLVIWDCEGHGILADRLHAGGLNGSVWRCKGTGIKINHTNGPQINVPSQSCWGYGLHAKDCGIGVRRNGATAVESGSPNRWDIWCENNNVRGPSSISTGYRYPQMKLTNCARIDFPNHTGIIANQVIMDDCSAALCTFGESFIFPRSKPTYSLEDIVEPGRWNCNWDTAWPDERYRPRWNPVDKTVTWPKGSFDKCMINNTAYWRMFPGRRSPGTYVFRVVVQDTNGAIADYCRRRNEASPRKAPLAGGFGIAPVAGGINAIHIWNKQPVEITGAFVVEDRRTDVTLEMMAYVVGMEGNYGTAVQTQEHVMKLMSCSFWEIP